MVQAIRPGLMSGLLRSAPVIGAAAAGVLVALTAVAMPTAWLEALAMGSGIAAVLPVAEPPLGLTARAVLALGGGLGVAAVVWAALYLLIGPGGPLARVVAPKRSDRPAVRRADAHPDAPPRWPLSATELPTPAPSSPPVAVPVERELPADLEMPLAGFDPDAVLPMPMEPVRAVKPLAPAVAAPLAPGERLETFKLKPPARPAAPAPAEAPTIDALLRRLEQGAQRRVAAR